MNGRSDHHGYIRAVAAQLREGELGIGVMNTRIGTREGLRWAELRLEPAETPYLQPDEDYVALIWDEERGWGWYVASDRPEERLWRGFEVAPLPAEVAAWAQAVVHTVVFPREETVMRSRDEESAQLEELLASFA
ncbi:DUF6292 family protein [Marinactinospora rubrisoli]|uniref:DUF6292 family protein n=1 Tax=Marinactinospora rubrisoli TaxID=2715399 RepID=A0ABW2KPS8_9ACTN